MSTTDSLEREVKFTADAAFELPDLRGTVGQTVRLPEQSLVTSYFDTPDLRLWERGITLRHRRGEGSEAGTWTLKLPEGHSVQELERRELTWAGDEAALPPGARRILRGVVGRASLVGMSTQFGPTVII
jgi:inorganic triphosphatase YgiF